MQPLLSVARYHPNGTSTEHALFRDHDSYLVLSATGHARTLPAAGNPVDAIRRSRLLHVAHLRQTTRLLCLDPEALPHDQILDAIRPIDEPERRDDSDEDAHVYDAITEANHIWSTRHRIRLDGRPVYAVETSTGPVVVHADDYDRPYDSWNDLLTLSWDSSQYAGVGMAGYGTEGLYLIRPGVTASVSATDESLEVHIDRHAPGTSHRTLISRCLEADLGNDRILAHLALAAYGFTADDLYPDDAVTCTLNPADIRRLLGPLAAGGTR